MIIEIPKLTISTRAGDVVIEPMRMGKLKAFSDAIQPVFGEIASMVGDDAKQQDIPSLIARHYDDLVALVCVACPVQRAHIDDMHLDDFVSLVGAVIEVNADFFTKSLLPTMKGVFGSLREKVLPALSNLSGPTASSA